MQYPAIKIQLLQYVVGSVGVDKLLNSTAVNHPAAH